MTGVPPALTDLVSASSVMGANAVVKPASFVGSKLSAGAGALTGLPCCAWGAWFMTGMSREGILDAATGWA